MKNFLALLVFIGGFGAWYLYKQKEDTSNGLHETQMQIENYEKTVALRRKEHEAITKALALQKQVTDQRQNLAALNARQAALETTRAGLARQRQQAIGTLRQTFIGTTLPTLTLTTGRTLEQVRILKLDDAGISLALTSGILKVLPHELPPELRQRLHY